MCGIYNILRNFVASIDWTSPSIIAATYRNHRHPLRPWTEEEWKNAKKIEDFTKRKDGRPKYMIERLQLRIGDHSWEGPKLTRKAWFKNMDPEDLVRAKNQGDWNREQGQMSRW